MESLKALTITLKVLEFIVYAQPMSVVEDEGFHRLLKYLEPKYSLPLCKYFSETGIQFIINNGIGLLSGIDRCTKPRLRYRD